MAWPLISTGSPPKRGHLDRVRRCSASPLRWRWRPGPPRPIPSCLPPEQAFRFSARALDDRTLEARFAVADGYYLYREKLKFAVEPEIAGLAVPPLPPGKMKDDQFFGKVETYRGEVVVKLPLPAAAAGNSLVLVADSQGCADLGVCYPVNRQRVTLVLPMPGKGPGAIVEAHPRKKRWFN